MCVSKTERERQRQRQREMVYVCVCVCVCVPICVFYKKFRIMHSNMFIIFSDYWDHVFSLIYLFLTPLILFILFLTVHFWRVFRPSSFYNLFILLSFQTFQTLQISFFLVICNLLLILLIILKSFIFYYTNFSSF